MGSDVCSPCHNIKPVNFNPRSPCGERPSRTGEPHSRFPEYFNPRSPCGERQAFENSFGDTILISIHAPRVGSDDLKSSIEATINANFNPRSPCGERQSHLLPRGQPDKFQSTLPVWGATTPETPFEHFASAFQSTLPVWGATPGTS